MKINAFSLDLSSSRTFSQTQTTRVTHEFSFTDIIDSRLEGSRASPGSATAEGGVGLIDRFRLELTNMRQIMSDIMDRFQERMSGTSGYRFVRMTQVYAVPVREFSMFRAWEYSQTRTYSFEETENLVVSAGGMVRTADDREIDFTFELEMERSFFKAETMSYTSTGAVLMDPLIVQTDATAPLLWGGAFAFDLDLDGSDDELPLPGAGYGFLSLDLNQDGKINDGSELFGPSTGSGFGELAAYDLDGNAWIDEADDVFDRLTLWEKDDSGEMTLTALGEAGIGAIFLGGVDSRFDFRDDANETFGQVKKTSIALSEAGDVLGVQEVAFKV